MATDDVLIDLMAHFVMAERVVISRNEVHFALKDLLNLR